MKGDGRGSKGERKSEGMAGEDQALSRHEIRVKPRSFEGAFKELGLLRRGNGPPRGV